MTISSPDRPLGQAGLICSWAHKISSLDGWSRRAVAVGAGIISTAALAPLHVVPALFISFPCLIWLIDGTQNWRRAFGVGWWFGLGHFAAGLYWIAHSLVVDLRFAWLIPFAVLCIPAVIGLYIGVATALARVVRRGFLRIVVLAVTWILMEWSRGQLFTGFPWNPIGSVWVVSDVALQSAAYVGVLGLGLLTVLTAALFALLAYDVTGIRWRRLIPSAICMLIIFLPGLLRPEFKEPLTFHPDIRLRIVQPNISQKTKWIRTLRDKHLATYLSLSARPASASPTHLIWPETAVPFVVSRDAVRRQRMATVIPKDGMLLTGSIRTSERGVQPFKLWNSLHALSASGAIEKSHDKFHLVPFGEYIPLRSILGNFFGLKKITAGRTDFSAGPGPQTIQVRSLPTFSPLICYEVIFADGVVSAGHRPEWLLNITNDAWFGTSSGPYQHFAMARLRAVEQGLPLIRAANTGISGVIDPYGRVLQRLDLDTQGVVDSPLPKPTNIATIYSKFGDWPTLLLAMLVLLASSLRVIWGRFR
ncbi:MAG: apolipoprotein N-acyltransferase [Alphaproteobacteria bacterium]|nr:apolipoprotein N-acyltransferase [Alphaproteobacteria bacterium]